MSDLAIKGGKPVSEKLIPIARPVVSEKEIDAVADVLKSGYLRQGKICEKFENEFCEFTNAQAATTTSSGTSALHLVFQNIIKPKSEVIVPAFTHISPASTAHLTGGNLVFCDIDPKTFTIDVEDVKEKITNKTKVIVGIHLFGNSCEIDELIEIANEKNISLIWDAAQAFGTKYKGKDIGSFNDFVCFSFYPTKNIFTGEGGMITGNKKTIDKINLLKSHGQTQKYHHEFLGYNHRMTEIEAVMGLEQLKLVEEKIKKRRENANFFNKKLKSIGCIQTPYVKPYIKHSYNQYAILLNLEKLKCNRDDFAEALKAENIGIGIHYPKPLNLQPIFKHMKFECPVSEDISNRILSLPVHPSLEKNELEKIVKAVEKVVSFYEK